MDSNVKIHSKLNYKIKLDGQNYYPVIANLYGDYAEIIFYFPNERGNTLELKARCLDTKFIEHLSLSDKQKKGLKVFISNDLLNSIRYHEPIQFSFSSIKDANSIKGSDKYFELLR